MWFDSHCHLHLCEAPSSDVVRRAIAEGVDRMVTVGIDVESSRRAVELAANGSVYATVGVHPNDSGSWDDAAAATVEELLSHPGVVGVGETGLDFYRDEVDPEIQTNVFTAHIELAQRLDKALVVHTRESVRAAIDLLRRVGPPPRVVFHCWSGTLEQMHDALALGAYVSFAGNISFKNAEDLRRCARAAPADRILVETDSPFLAPVPLRGRPNEPRNAALVGRAVAEAREEDLGSMAETTSANAERAFGLS